MGRRALEGPGGEVGHASTLTLRLGRLRGSHRGIARGMFVWTKTPGRPARRKFYLWPLLLSLVVSVVLTVLLNLIIR